MTARILWLLAGTIFAMTAPASAEEPAKAATMCGRPGDMVQLLIEMQKPSIESVWRDKKMFVNRDNDDGSYWAFAVRDTTVHPAAICERQVKDGAAMKVESGQLCAASEKACASFATQVAERLAVLKADK
jgi:hypothetical protein